MSYSLHCRNHLPDYAYEVFSMTLKMTINRRSLLFAAANVAAGTMVASCTPGSPAQKASERYHPTYFTDKEWDFINAAVDRLIPSGGQGPGGVEAGVPEFIDRQLELPYGHGAYSYMQGPFLENVPAQFGYQLRHSPRELYRAAISLISDTCQVRWHSAFSKLTPTVQDDLLKQMESGKSGIAGPIPGAFFALLLENTKEGYFADPLYGGNRDMGAWKMIGFPGARADFTDWINRAGTPYPFGPVSVNGARRT
jgi:gluconate 2-dehydrogenase gamma chain